MAKANTPVAGYDAIVIGTGQAGPPLARRLAAAGMTVAIVERGAFGGTCVNTGCIPTKTLVASAYAAHMVRRAGEFGIGLQSLVDVDMTRVKARKDRISEQSRVGVEQSLRSSANCTVYQGHARFVAPHEVQVGDAVLAAEQIFINVGGRAVVPTWPGLDQVPYLTNSSMMEVDFVPRHLVIVGGSYVGLEFAQMYRRFGSEVTVVEMAPRLVHREDTDASAAIAEILESEGIGVRVKAECIRLAPEGRRCPGRPRLHRRTARNSRVAPAARGRPPAEHRRSRTRRGRDRPGRTRLHQSRRSAAHQCAGGVGARRLQR